MIDPTTTHDMTRAVPGDKRCAECGMTAGTKAHKAAREARVQDTPVQEAATVELTPVQDTPVQATPVQAHRTTLKGHGNPTRIMYYGGEKTPATEGWLVTVVKVRGGADLVDESGGHTAGWAASATKFWGAPVQDIPVSDTGVRHLVGTNDGRGNVRVHVPGCRDIDRESKSGGTWWPVSTPDVRGFVMHLFPDATAEDWQGYADVQVMPCVPGGLAEVAQASAQVTPVTAQIETEEINSKGEESIMRVTVPVKDLAGALGFVARNIAARPGVPILAGVVLDANGSTLTVRHFDFETFRSADVAASDVSAGTVVVSGQTFADAVKKLPKGVATVQLVEDGCNLTMVAGGITRTFPTMPVEDVPTVADVPHVIGHVDAGMLADLAGRVKTAVGTDDTVPALTCVRVVTNGARIELAATDRYRLHIAAGTWQPVEESPGLLVAPSSEYLVPGGLLAECAALYAKRAGKSGATVEVRAETVRMADGRMIGPVYGLACDGYSMLVRTYDGHFPPVDKLIPDTFPGAVTVSATGLVDMIGRVADMGAKNTLPLILRLFPDSGEVRAEFYAGDDGNPTAVETLTGAVFSGDVPDTVAYNPRYLTAAVRAAAPGRADTVTVHITSAFKPAVCRNPKYPEAQALIMPIRVSGGAAETRAAAKRAVEVPAAPVPADQPAPAPAPSPTAMPATSTDAEVPAEVPAWPWTLPDHLTATIKALTDAAEASGWFKISYPWVPAGRAQDTKGEWTTQDSVSVQIGTPDGYHGDGKSHVVVSWDSWTDCARVQPNVPIHTIDQVREYLAGYRAAMESCRFPSDGLERIYRAVSGNRNPYSNPLPRQPFSTAPAVEVAAPTEQQDTPDSAETSASVPVEAPTVRDLLDKIPGKVIPSDFDPFREQIRGCACPVCEECAAKSHHWVAESEKMHAARVLLAHLVAGIHVHVTYAERIADAKRLHADKLDAMRVAGATDDEIDRVDNAHVYTRMAAIQDVKDSMIRGSGLGVGDAPIRAEREARIAAEAAAEAAQHDTPDSVETSASVDMGAPTVTLIYPSDGEPAPDVPAAGSAPAVAAGPIHGAHAQRIHVTGLGDLDGYRFHVATTLDGETVRTRPMRKLVGAALVTAFGRKFAVTAPAGRHTINVAVRPGESVDDWSPVLALVADTIGAALVADECTACDRSYALVSAE